MPQLVYEKDIHLRVPTPNNTTQVNPIPVDSMDFTINGQTTDYLYKGSKNEAGALYSPKPDIDIPSWATYFGYNRRVKYLSFETLAQDEYDYKFTLNEGQINLSTQINFANSKGAFQWDPNNPPKWEDSGLNALQYLDPGDYNDFMARCSTDRKTWALEWLAVNSHSFNCGTLRRVPLATSSWTKMKAHNQEQAQVINSNPPAPIYTMKRYIKTEVIFSDAPIPLTWFS